MGNRNKILAIFQQQKFTINVREKLVEEKLRKCCRLIFAQRILNERCATMLLTIFLFINNIFFHTHKAARCVTGFFCDTARSLARVCLCACKRNEQLAHDSVFGFKHWERIELEILVDTQYRCMKIFSG